MNIKIYVSALAMKLYLIPLLVACLFFAGCSPTEVFFSSYSAQCGVFDCSTIDFTKEKPVELKGEWKYRMLEDSPAFARPDYDDSEWDYIIIPNYWNSEKFKGDGYGWYRLKVKVNKSFWETSPAIYVPGANTAYELYFNGNKFMCSGIVSIDEQSSSPCLKPQLKPLNCEKETEEFVIAVKVSNFFHRGGGLNKCIVIGPFESITQILWEHDFIKTVILGIIFIIAVYHLILWMGRRKDKTSFWFSIFCFAIFSHSFVIGNYLERIFYNSDVFFIRFSIEYGSLGLGWLSFTLYVCYLFPRESNRMFVIFQIITGIIFISIPMILPPKIFTNLIGAYNVILFTTMIGAFIILIAASIRRRDDALLIFIGYIVLMITVANDILHNLFIIRTFFMSEY
ncbi:MAG TPA: 7TM-DISM domain-containing protein, partial [Spirochaetota bacterium]|nr:7TM-DISM domain-containing protein [Spirochaetota bacterium]